MIEIIYLLSLILTLLILKPHPTSVVFVFIVNMLSGFTPLITSVINYDTVLFDKELVLLMLFIFNISIFIPHIIYLLNIKKGRVYHNFKIYKYSRVVFLLFSLFSLFLVYQNINQGIQVMNSGYIAGYQDASNQTIKATSFFPFLLMFYFFLFIFYLTKGKKIYLILMVCIIASYLIYGGRSFLLYTSISSVVFLILIRRVTYKKFVIVSALSLPFLVFAGAFREGGTGALDTTMLFRMAMEMANIPMIISNLNVLDDLNQPLITVALSALPHSLILPLGVEPINSLSTEFVTNYDPGWAKSGGGFGFTIIGEIYYRFGYLGLMIVPYFIVMLLHNLEKKLLKGDDFDKVLVLTFYYGMLMWVRGDFIEISRLLMIVLFFYYTKRLVYRHGK
ncbi:hypothetical protein BCT19_18430 [Vibrio splendidus]|uniref:O-antigen polysaccharide polymerase Wzy n=1 Tax=Vibrio splendidus TaxID=29497 RepID=UPI000C8515BD|nr:O-antigen polysaccharide polymerase Wzy [Vibrio splendidus]MCC5519744.1 oligosaccharide repeat unit polymerase [Vibrio splendidus]PMO03256.1 hypothetical protein BCT19_18430 [Vibrio splendidus]